MAAKKKVNEEVLDTETSESTGTENGNERNLSEIFSELDGLLQAMESEESLEKTFQMYQKGVGLLKTANDSIDRIEKQVKVLDDEGFLS